MHGTLAASTLVGATMLTCIVTAWSNVWVGLFVAAAISVVLSKWLVRDLGWADGSAGGDGDTSMVAALGDEAWGGFFLAIFCYVTMG